MDGMDWFTVVGTLASLLGIGVALSQLNKTRKAAEAAKEAAGVATNAIKRNVALIDVTACINEIEALKTMIRTHRIESALLRVTDLSSKLIQLKNILTVESQDPIEEMSKVLSQVRILKDVLERKLHDEETTSKQVFQMNKTLSDISDILNAWIGKRKYIPEEKNHDSQ